MVDVALALGHVDRVEALPLGEHAQCQHRENLRLAAGEQARAVGARQVAGDRSVTWRTSSSLRPSARSPSSRTMVRMVFFSSCLSSALMSLPIAAISSSEKVATTSSLTAPTASMRACLSALCSASLILSAPAAKTRSRRASSIDVRAATSMGVISHWARKLLLDVAELADRLHGELECGEHVLLGDLVGAGLDHVDGVAGTGDREVEIGLLELVEGRVDEELALDACDAHAGERALERDAGDHERRGRTHDRDDVGLVDLVDAENRSR